MHILCIGDIHLKFEIFDMLETVLQRKHPDKIILLGDLVDDWEKEDDFALYQKTLSRFSAFMRDHDNCLFCYGNHDLSYLYTFPETGFSWNHKVQKYVKEEITELEAKYGDRMRLIHKFDNYIFLHGGLSKTYTDYVYPGLNDIDSLIEHINADIKDPDKTWWDGSLSPIWLRPTSPRLLYPGVTQIVGHTPVKTITRESWGFSCDTFSTFPDGAQIGDRSILFVDTATENYSILM